MHPLLLPLSEVLVCEPLGQASWPSAAIRRYPRTFLGVRSCAATEAVSGACVMSAIAELEQDRVVEGVYAVAKKERLRTRSGGHYLALELVDPSGRIEARVWNDVELLEQRFAEGDAVRVLGRVDRFRDRLQLEVRSIEVVADADPAELAPAMRRDA